jgi:hypothetical protein
MRTKMDAFIDMDILCLELLDTLEAFGCESVEAYRKQMDKIEKKYRKELLERKDDGK